MIGDDLPQFDDWYKKGVRIVGFNHAGNNDLSDSARPNLLRGDKLDEHGGLSDIGKRAVAKLNDLGVVIDVSQLSGKALAQVLSLTRAPVVASHSNARAIIDHPRNLDDGQLLAIAKQGGVVGWSDESEAPNVTAELLKRGYKETDIAKPWGGNFLRVWETARSLAKTQG